MEILELKSMVTEIKKNKLEGLNSRFELAEEGISKCEKKIDLCHIVLFFVFIYYNCKNCS